MKHEAQIEITADKNRLDVPLIHGFLTKTYWATGRSIEQVQKTIDHSLCLGIYLNGNQIGFCRAVTDTVVYAYLMDVFIAEPHRGKGYSKMLLKAFFEHPDLADIQKWALKTSDAQGLYGQFGFEGIMEAGKYMEWVRN